MNKEYQGNSIELRAKELLASIQGNCPDMVWNEINVELEAKRSKASEKWLSKYNTPRAAVIVTICVAVVTLVSWKFVFGKKSTDISVYQAPQPTQQIVNTPPPVKQAAATVVTQPKKDSVVVNKTVPIPNTVVTATNSQPMQVAMNNNKPIVLQKPVVKDNTPTTNSTPATAMHSGGASVSSEQPDSTFSLHRSGMAPMSSGAAVQDTVTN
ncbi:MAG TPA: hypothetical protein VK806_11375 [Bacteroidia bacterium]|jgi:hypothetical protein|nr:hypothetical protein [Bacteroidia bacterium]